MELLWRGVGVEGRGDYRAASVPRDDPRMWGQEALKLGDIAEDEVEDLGDACELEAGRWVAHVGDEGFPKGGRLLQAGEGLVALKERVGVVEGEAWVDKQLVDEKLFAERKKAFGSCGFDGERRAAAVVEVVEGVDAAYLLELASELLDLLA